MAILPTSSSCLELTISMPGFTSYHPLPSSGDQGGGGGMGSTVMRNLDINQIPSGGGGEEEEEWTTASIEEDDLDDNNNIYNIITTTTTTTTTSSNPPRKKLRLTKEQSRLLEESFRLHHTLNPKQKEALALQLKLKPRQVEVWFQNRRARSKLKQTEMECEYLKRWFGSLREQNRRLQKEVEELRAMKVSPPTVVFPHGRDPLPASTLSMCPRCERVTTAPSTVANVDKCPVRAAATTATAAALASRVTMVHTRHN